MNKPIIELLKVQYRSFFREPGIVFWAIVFPMIIAGVLGFAFTEKAEIRKTIFLIGDGAKIDQVKGKTMKIPGIETPVFITFKSANSDQAVTALKRGEINLYMEEKNGLVVYNYDTHNPDAMNTQLMLEQLFSPAPVSRSEIKAITTTGNRYIDFLIPGLIALGIMNSCMWGISYNLIEYRMKKLLRRMIATPMKKSDFLISNFLFRVFICAIEAVFLVVFARIFFQSEVMGSWLAFVLLFFAGVICFSGIAILTASRTQNTQVGNGLMNAVILPMTILSGIFFSYHNFPEWVQSIIKYLPLTLLADNIRAIFIEGAGLQAIGLPIALLVGIGLACYAIGIRIFKWY